MAVEGQSAGQWKKRERERGSIRVLEALSGYGALL